VCLTLSGCWRWHLSRLSVLGEELDTLLMAVAAVLPLQDAVCLQP
jgi:hypothetical protein